MAKAVISYDKDLPEIEGRQPHLPPNSYLRKKARAKDEFEEVPGRRPSKLLLVNRSERRLMNGGPLDTRALRPFRNGFSHTGLMKIIWLTGKPSDTTSASGRQLRRWFI